MKKMMLICGAALVLATASLLLIKMPLLKT